MRPTSVSSRRTVMRRRVAVARTPQPPPPSMAGGGLLGRCRGGRREIVAEPAAQQVPHARVVLTEHEMVGIADQMQLGRLSRALEHLDRLLRGRDRIVGGMQQQQRTGRDLADDLVGAESYMLCAVSAGNEWMELPARLLRRCGGIGTMS